MARPQVYVTRRVPAAALETIAAGCNYRLWDSDAVPVPRDRLALELAQADGALVMLSDRIDGPLLDAAPRCRVIANMAVGYDNIDVPACTARGVLATHTPGVLTETTADLTFALMLAAARRVVEGQKLIESGGWTAWHPMFMTGVDVHGATLGIIGAGRIGSAVARRASGFGMRILYHNRRPNPALEQEVGAAYCGLDELLQAADFVSLLVPLAAETRGLIGARELALMKPTAVLVNTARGPIVDEAALYAALRDRRIYAAGLDVFEREPIPPNHPLLSLPNCVCVPHVGSATVATRTRMATLAAENLAAALAGRRPPAPLNPEVLAGRS